jgi:hypothetical protein
MVPNYWVSALREQGDLTKKVSKEIRTALDRPDLTQDQALSICDLVEMGAGTFDRFIRSAKQQNLSPQYYEAAKILADIWDALALDASSKLKAMEDRVPNS